jgi:hypothetical protein
MTPQHEKDDAMRNRNMMAAGMAAGAAKAISGGGNAEYGVTATGSTSQANSYGIKAAITTVTGGGANTGVRLPSNAETGDEFWILNDKGSTLFVYPPSGGAISGGTADAKVDLTDNTAAVYKALPGGNFMAA